MPVIASLEYYVVARKRGSEDLFEFVSYNRKHRCVMGMPAEPYNPLPTKYSLGRENAEKALMLLKERAMNL